MNRPDSARPKSGRKFALLPKTANPSAALRPVTQQGLTGVRPAQSPLAGQTRIHKDKRYYASLIQVHEREIREEMAILKKQTDEHRLVSAKAAEYKRIAERLAKECNEKQEQLNVYNTVLSTHLSKANEEDILAETVAYRRKNEELVRVADEMLANKMALEEELRLLQAEMDEVKKRTEKEVERLGPDDRAKYKALAKENESYLQGLSDLKSKIKEVQDKLAAAEDNVSEAKKKKIKLLEEKRQLQEQIAALEKEIDESESPEQLQAKLLAQVKSDRADTEALAKALEGLENELKNKQDYVQEMDNEMDSKNKDRLKKLKDLRERGEEMKKFIEESNVSIPELREKIKAANEMVETALEHASISTIDLKVLREDFDETKYSDDDEKLHDYYEALKQKYARVVKLGDMYKYELEALKKSNDEMKAEMRSYENPDAMEKELLQKKEAAEETLRELEQKLKTTEEVIENARIENEALEADLDKSKLYAEVKDIESKIEDCKSEIEILKTKIGSVEGAARSASLFEEVTRLADKINESIIIKQRA